MKEYDRAETGQIGEILSHFSVYTCRTLALI